VPVPGHWRALCCPHRPGWRAVRVWPQWRSSIFSAASWAEISIRQPGIEDYAEEQYVEEAQQEPAEHFLPPILQVPYQADKSVIGQSQIHNRTQYPRHHVQHRLSPLCARRHPADIRIILLRSAGIGRQWESASGALWFRGGGYSYSHLCRQGSLVRCWKSCILEQNSWIIFWYSGSSARLCSSSGSTSRSNNSKRG